MADQVVMWAGKPIVDMSREELIDVVQSLARMIREQDAAHQSTLNAWRTCQAARAGGFGPPIYSRMV